MQSEPEITEHTEPAKGRSLWADAWGRLLKNRMAVAGTVVVFLMGLSALFAPYIAPFPATYQQFWVGSKPPGYNHPRVLSEMLLEVGKEPEIPDRVKGASTLRFEVVPEKREDYRAVLRGPRITSMKQETGALMTDRVEVKGDRERFVELLADGNLGTAVRNMVLETGKELAPEFGLTSPGPKEPWVLTFARITALTEKPLDVRAKITGGKVKSITKDGEPLDSITVHGREVTRFEADGELVDVTHWLGTDQSGRDVLSRVIFGGRISLLVGLVATLVSLVIGVVYGAASGYFGDAPIHLIDILLFAAAVLLAIAGYSMVNGHLVYWVILGGALVGVVGGGLILMYFAIRPYHTLKKSLAGGPLRFLLVRVLGVDNFMMRGVDILYGLPYMFLVILLLVNFGRDIVVLFIALGAVQWLTMARIVRGQVLSLKEKEFVEAARMAGAGHFALIFRHLIPNTLGIVAVYTTLTIPAVILQESFLAFIGLAVQYQGENLASWGALVDQGRQALGTGGDRWWMLIFPSLAMAATLFSLNFLGDGLRDALDPQQKGRT
ncbi:MAG: ABC transporter permease [Planctomycetota bacterium]|jgi:ABC-type dipeptide/oligopeptide/nickel transport system permease subunit